MLNEFLLGALLAYAVLAVLLIAALLWSWVFDDNFVEEPFWVLMALTGAAAIWPLAMLGTLMWFAVPEVWRATRWHKKRHRTPTQLLEEIERA